METGLGSLESSPFASRIYSNYAATNSESLEIQSLLKGPTSRLEELSIRLQELDEQCAQIRNDHTSLLLYISKHRALTSLVRKLPIEILQEIFIACLPTAHNAVMSKQEPPILLTQVCSSWRNIAHKTPQLWKSLHIAVPCTPPGIYAHEHENTHHEQLSHRRSEAALEWITRSAACPLDISLGIPLGQWGSSIPDGLYDRLIEYLIRFSDRWREISLSAPYQALIPVAALPASSFPLLESLSLNGIQSHFATDIPAHPIHRPIWITSGVMKAPKLREICLTQLYEDAAQFPVNWSQLTNLSLDANSWNTSISFSVATVYKILSSCWKLISCRLEIGTAVVPDDEEPIICETRTALVSLPFLTKLSIREGTNLSTLFTLLHLPSLISLEFRTVIWPGPNSSTGLLSLLMRSSGMIQHLTIDPQFIKQQDFIKCLRLCPLLKSLTITHALGSPSAWTQPGPITCAIDDAFLDMFTSSSSSDDDNSNGHGNDGAKIDLEDPEGCLCPNLEDFESSSETKFSESTLLQFIRRKNGDHSSGEPPIPGLAKLKTVFIIFPGHRRPLNDIIPELQLASKQPGLAATILYHPPPPFIARFSPFDGLPVY